MWQTCFHFRSARRSYSILNVMNAGARGFRRNRPLLGFIRLISLSFYAKYRFLRTVAGSTGLAIGLRVSIYLAIELWTDHDSIRFEMQQGAHL